MKNLLIALGLFLYTSSSLAQEAKVPEVKLPKIKVASLWLSEFNADHVGDFLIESKKVIAVHPDIWAIYISSYGGDPYSYLAMADLVDAVKAHGIIVATIAVGPVLSCGAFFFTEGTPGYRFATKHSTFLFHDVSTEWFSKNQKLKSLAAVAEAEETERLTQAVYTRLIKNVSAGFLEIIKQKRAVDFYLQPEEAKELGLVNTISLPPFFE